MMNNWQLVPVEVGGEKYNLEPNDLFLAMENMYSQMAFGRTTREEIKARAGGRSEVSGRNDLPLEASHFFHGRSEEQQQASNGVLLTLPEHLEWHRRHRNSPEDINLTRSQNEWAIGQIFMRLVYTILGKGGDVSDVRQEMQDAREDMNDAWKDYFPTE